MIFLANGQLWVKSDKYGDDGATVYNYNTSSELGLVTYPDGSWMWLTNYSGNRPTEIWSPFLNSLPTASASNHRVTTFSYDTQNAGVDNESVLSNALRRVTQKVAGTTVEQTFRILSTDRVEYRRGQNSGATGTSSDDLVTVVNNYGSGVFKGEPFTIQNENGTVDVFYYTTNSTSKTTTRLSGESGSPLTNIVKGTKTVTQIGIAGDLIAETVYSIPGDHQIFSKSVVAADDMRRPVRINYMDGTFEGFSYDCCGYSSQTNRDGSVVTYAYDALKRRISETREGVTHMFGYDALGQLLTVTRQGTNGNSHTVLTRVYNLSGRLQSEENALEEYATFTQSTNSSSTVRTATFMNGATWSEKTATDGSLQEVSGTGARPLKFYYGTESTGDSGTNGPANAQYTKVVRVATGGGENEWTKTYSDMIGRNYKRTYAAASGTPTERLWFNSRGQLAREQDADSVNWLYLFNNAGELEAEVLDMDRDNVVDWAGTDQITKWVNQVTNVSGVILQRYQYAWETNTDTATLVSTLEMTGDWLTARKILANGGTPVTYTLQRIINSGGGAAVEVEPALGRELSGGFHAGTFAIGDAAQFE